MLQLSSALLNKPVMSLRTGAPVATATTPLINPNNLKIEGIYCIDRFNKGYIINDHDVLSEPSELIRLSETIKVNFQLIGKQVVTVSKDKVGKVSDYAVEIETMYIQKLYVSQSLLKNFAGGSLSIDRTQINEVTDKRIIINDLLSSAAITAPAAVS
jgi:sporulation protein YlmC with PRC-barrel domain